MMKKGGMGFWGERAMNLLTPHFRRVAFRDTTSSLPVPAECCVAATVRACATDVRRSLRPQQLSSCWAVLERPRSQRRPSAALVA